MRRSTILSINLNLVSLIGQIILNLFNDLAGWPDWGILRHLGYFWKFSVLFWKDKVAQRNHEILGYFFL